MTLKVSTVSWVNVRTLTNKCHDLVSALMEYQKYSIDAHSKPGDLHASDQAALVAAINLRNILNKVIEKSNSAPIV